MTLLDCVAVFSGLLRLAHFAFELHLIDSYYYVQKC